MSTKVGSDPPTSSDAPPDDQGDESADVWVTSVRIFGLDEITVYENTTTGEWFASQPMAPLDSDEDGFEVGTPDYVKAPTEAALEANCRANSEALRQRDPHTARMFLRLAETYGMRATRHGHSGPPIVGHINGPIHVQHARPRQIHAAQSAAASASSASKSDPSSSSSDDSPRAPGQRQERLEELIYRLLAEVELDQAERREARKLQRELLDELRAHGARLAAQAWRERRAA